MAEKEPTCSLCGKGALVPVNLGKNLERFVIYRCTNHECNARFDEHGYELYDMDKQVWKKLAQG